MLSWRMRNATNAARAVHASKICVTGLDISKPSWEQLSQQQAKNNLSGITLGTRLVFENNAPALHPLLSTSITLSIFRHNEKEQPRKNFSSWEVQGKGCRLAIHLREKLMSTSQSLGFSVITERADGLAKSPVLTTFNFMQFKQIHLSTEHPVLALSVFFFFNF